MLQRIRDVKTSFSTYAKIVSSLALQRLPDNTPFLFFCLVLLTLPLLAALAFSLVYLCSFLAGLPGAYPCREFFLWFPSLDFLFVRPRGIAEAIFAYALVGAGAAYLLRQGGQKFIQKIFSAIAASWNLLSILFLVSLLLATLGHGIVAFETQSYSILGVLPYSDANAHSLSYSKYFSDFAMGNFALRRPLGAFMGAGIRWLADCDPFTDLMLRALLVAFAMWVSCAAMRRFFGVWSATACLAIEYYHVWKFLGICTTETLGFFWGCLAIALWLQALHQKRLFWDLAAFSVTLIGLLTRMGSMLLLPALCLYIFWRGHEISPRPGWWKAPLLGLALCVAAVLALDTSLSRRGYADASRPGSNFAPVLASLSLGTENGAAYRVYAKEISALGDEKQRSRFFYRQALTNILHDPAVFLGSLLKGETAFLKNFDFFLFYNWWPVILLCLLLLLRRGTLFPRAPALFWGAVWLAVFLSIPFIYFSESRRVNIFVYPLVACFFSLGLAGPGSAGEARSTAPALAAWGTIALTAAMLLMMASVAFFPRLHLTAEAAAVRAYVARLPAPAPGTVLVSAQGRGILVVPDGETADATALVLPWSAFRDGYLKLGQRDARPFLDSLESRLPFAALNLPVLAPADWPYEDTYFIAPPEILTQKKVQLWDLGISRQIWDKRLHIRWNIVTSATPVHFK